MVRLEDARGFWRRYERRLLRWKGRSICRPRGQVWDGDAFRRQPNGVYRSDEPAIGPSNGRRDELTRPGGWHRPEAAQ